MYFIMIISKSNLLKMWKAITILFYLNTYSQQIIFPKLLCDKQIDSCKVDSLRNNFGSNKTYPSQFELPILIALSQYPELKNIKIKFKFAKFKHASMMSLFTTQSLLRQKHKRHYVILINNNSKEKKYKLFLQNSNYDSQIAVIGHELAHTTQYLQKTNIGLLTLFSTFFIKKVQKKLEREADYLTIKHNLGYQLFQRKQFDELTYPIRKRAKLYLSAKEVTEYNKKLYTK